MMFKQVIVVFICFVGLLTSNPAAAQPPPPPPPGPLSGTDVPFDTQSTALFISATLFGAYKIGTRKQMQKSIA